MSTKREEARPCFCGKGRISECWYDGTWSHVTLQCAACDELYEYRVVGRAEDGTEKTDWIKRASPPKPNLPEGRTNPCLDNHDYTGKPVHADLFGSMFASDSVGHVFVQPNLSDLKHFDSVGLLYIMHSESIPDSWKIGVTKRPLKERAREHTRDFFLAHPFQVVAAFRVRNYLLAEYFLKRRLMHFQTSYIKARMYFREIRHRALRVRTHRSSELYRCSFPEVYSQVSLILKKAPEVMEFEKWFLEWLLKQLESYSQMRPEETHFSSSWKMALDTIHKRLSAGETSMCILETLH